MMWGLCMPSPRNSIEKVKERLLASCGSSVTIDANTYRTMNEKARFIDIDHGEWWATPTKVIVSGHRHPGRSVHSIESIIEALNKTHSGLVTLDISTYKGTHKRARFVDAVHGEWWASAFKVVFSGNEHPNRVTERRTASIRKSHSDPEFIKRMSALIKSKYDDIKKTNLERYGVENNLQRPDVIQARIARFKTPEVLAKKQFVKIERRKRHALKKRQKRLLAVKDPIIVKNRILSNESRLRRLKTMQEMNYFKNIEGLTVKSIWEKEFKDHISYSYACKILAKSQCSTIDSFRKALLAHASMSDIETAMANNKHVTRFNKNPAKGCNLKPDFKINNNIFVNIDGLYWHSEKMVDKDLHLNARLKMESHGLRLLQFRADELTYKPAIVNSMISVKSGNAQKVFARKLRVQVLNTSEARTFFNKNHLMGFASASTYIGLVNDLGIKCAISFTIQNRVAKIVRFASVLDTVVVGGYSKLLKYFINLNLVDDIYTFVDLRYGSSASLEKMGFEHVGTTLGWKWTDYDKTFNRLICRANMDNRGLTQEEHAKELRLVKIYDAGQAKMALNIRKVQFG